MTLAEKMLLPYPEVMTRLQFQTVCHIGTRTAIAALQNGEVSSNYQGERLKIYKIPKSEVLAYLERKLKEIRESGEDYPDWYCEPDLQTSIVKIDYEKAKREEVRTWYEQCLDSYPDLLTTDEIAVFTGYDRKTIMRWLLEGRINYISKSPRYMIPKLFLIDFLVSDDYNSILRKSRLHLKAIMTIRGEH